MVKSAEEIWQDALDSRERGDFVSAIDYAKEVVNIEEDNAEAWMAIATWSLHLQLEESPHNLHCNNPQNQFLL